MKWENTLNNCLITGITGMVGSHLADYIIENTDWNIYGLCRWNDNYDNINHLIPQINNKERITLLYGDLNDYPSLQETIAQSKPDYVFHLAAQSYPKTSFIAPLETLQTNIMGTANLLEVIRKSDYNPITHVCASSEIFGRVSKQDLPIHEDVGFHPASPYAISKVGTDLIGRYYAEAYDMPIMTTRMFTHTGPRRGDVFAESTFAKQIAMIEAGIQEPIIKVGNLDSLRTWSDVRDAVHAYFLLVTKNPVAGEYYNIGGSHSCTIGEMLEYLLSLSICKNITIETDPERLRPIDADLQVPDTSKFQKHTGWKPEISFEKTMKDLLNYWRNNVSKGKNYLAR
jgi:GDP-mannose 4,6-dehydratase